MRLEIHLPSTVRGLLSYRRSLLTDTCPAFTSFPFEFAPTASTSLSHARDTGRFHFLVYRHMR